MIYFLAGDNQFEVKLALSKFINDFTLKHGDLAVERIDAEEASADTIIESALSLPFLSPAKLVIVSNASNKELLEKLVEVDLPDAVTVIVLVPKPDKRASYYKKISKHSNFKLFTKDNVQNLPRWVVDYAKNQAGVISLADARYLIDRVGSDQLLLGNEVDKLILFNSHVNKDSINDLTEPTPQSTVFQLLEYAFAGQAIEAETIYKEQRSQKVEPQLIIGMIAWQLHLLALIKSAGNKPANVIAKEAKINPYVVQKSQNLARKLTVKQIKKLVKDALDLDVTLKTQKVDADQAMLIYLTQIM